MTHLAILEKEEQEMETRASQTAVHQITWGFVMQIQMGRSEVGPEILHF